MIRQEAKSCFARMEDRPNSITELACDIDSLGLEYDKAFEWGLSTYKHLVADERRGQYINYRQDIDRDSFNPLWVLDSVQRSVNAVLYETNEFLAITCSGDDGQPFWIAQVVTNHTKDSLSPIDVIWYTSSSQKDPARGKYRMSLLDKIPHKDKIERCTVICSFPSLDKNSKIPRKDLKRIKARKNLFTGPQLDFVE